MSGYGPSNLLVTCAGFSAWKAIAGEATPDGNPFRAYPWFPIPDALTREQRSERKNRLKACRPRFQGGDWGEDLLLEGSPRSPKIPISRLTLEFASGHPVRRISARSPFPAINVRITLGLA